MFRLARPGSAAPGWAGPVGARGRAAFTQVSFYENIGLLHKLHDFDESLHILLKIEFPVQKLLENH